MIILRLGMCGLNNMNESDLLKLAWAISKQPAGSGDVIRESIGAELPPAILIKWVLQMALTGLSDRFDDLISAADHILQHEADYYGLSVHFAQVEPI
jgi:hypothetical protein